MIGYGFFLKEKNKEFNKVNEGFCPKCKNQTVDIVDIRGSGCSPKIITFRCQSCGYENSFTQPSNCSL